MEADDETTSVTMIDDEIYSNGGVGDGEEKRKPNLSSELLDVEVYASLYSGRTKVTRLIFIADRCNNQAMKLEALRMAYEEIKKGENTNLFKEVVEKIDGKLGSEYGLDQSWVDNVDRKADVRKEKLENELNAYRLMSFVYNTDGKADVSKEESELNAYRTNLIKESIRMGYNNFGNFHYSRGHLVDALENYARSLDHCTTSEQVLQMCFILILLSIEMGQFSHVATFVGKAEATPDALDPVAVAKLRCAAGLSHLASKKYKLAARKFLETGPELGSSYTEVIAPQDVATYGGLCALASFDRAEFKNKVIDNVYFQNFLEPVPEVREIINEFYSSRYASCLDYLESLKGNLLLDIHLHEHVEQLCSYIRQRAMIEYINPSLSVDLCLMAEAFKTNVCGLECELEAVLLDRKIQARIDSKCKILCPDHSPILFKADAAASSEVERCQKIITRFTKALAVVDEVEKLVQLEDQIIRIDFILNESKMLQDRDRMDLEGQKASLNENLIILKEKCVDGIRGKNRNELNRLLSKAKEEFSAAQTVKSRAKKEYLAAGRSVQLTQADALEE